MAFGKVSDTFGRAFKRSPAILRSVCSVFSCFYSHTQNQETAMQTAIKTQSKTIASLLAASLVALTLGTAAAHAAEAGDPLTKTIAYGDLNLETADGARVLYARVRDAAHAVCSPFEGREPARQIRWQACYDHAMASAVAQIDKPRVTALHSEKTKASRQS
jgi:UrcA family protein